MKRLTIKVISCLASFALGVAVSSFVNWINQRVSEQPRTNVAVQCPRDVMDQPPATVAPEPEASPRPEIVFGGGHLRIVSARVQLKDERLRYRIDITYPQVVSSDNAGSEDLHIRKLNRRLEELANQQTDWAPSKADLRYYREKWPDVFNSTDVDYQIISATDSFLSIYFNGYSYGIGAAHSVQYSFVVNYDLVLQKEVKLSDIFAPRSKYLQFIAQYCTDELSKKPAYMFGTALSPRPANFKSWNVTRNGIRFNFDECSVFSCADGEQEVEIPFAKLKEFLNVRALKAFGNS